MPTINVQIDLSTPTGRRLLREVEKYPKAAKVDYPFPEGIAGQQTYTLEESYKECENILSKNYGVDVSKL